MPLSGDTSRGRLCSEVVLLCIRLLSFKLVNTVFQRKNEPIMMLVDTCGPWNKGMKRSTLHRGTFGC